MTDFYLAYHGSNTENAETIANRLSNSNYEITHIPILGEAGPYLSERLISLKRPILLLVSDNFLKSTICMYDALNVLKSLINDELIFPIIVDGNYGKGSDNKKIKTEFSKVSDVIGYMNHWRDRFLEARKEKKSFLITDKDDHAKQIQELRSISAEAGEYLRLLRDIEHIRYEDIQESDFELLYKFIQKQRYVNVKPTDSNIEKTEPAIPKIDPVDAKKQETVPASIEHIINSIGDKEEKTKVDQIIEHKANTTPESKLSKDDGFIEVKNLELDLRDGFAGEMISDKPLEEIVTPIDDAPLKEADLSKKKATIKDAEDGNFDHTKTIISDSIEIFEAGQYEAGYLFLEDYLKYNPTNIDVRMHLANMRYDFGDKDKAANDMLYILKLDNRNLQAHKWMAEYYEINTNPSKSLHHLLQVKAIDSDSFEIDYRLGMLLKNHIKDLKTAKTYFESALEKNPQDAKSKFQLGLINKELGDEENATKQLKETLDIKETKPESNYELAKIFLKSNDLEKVKLHWKNALAEDPKLEDKEITAFLNKEKKKKEKKDRLEEIRRTLESERNISVEEPIRKKSKATPKKKTRKKRKVKTILITGATAGIGRATAIELANRGHRLVLTGRRSDKLEELSKELKKGKIKTLTFDVRDYDVTKRALSSLEGKWAQIDVLINNAGLAQGKDPIHEASIEDWNTMIDTNVKGILHTTRILAPHMAKRKKGHIINICSTAGHEVYPGGSVYCASKFAVRALTKGMRMDLHKYNIRISQVSPGAVEETEFAKVRFHGDEEKAKIYDDFTPVNSRDVAKIIRFVVTRPKRVNIEEILVMGTQQASAMVIDKSGRKNG